jgi:hypothetical protein
VLEHAPSPSKQEQSIGKNIQEAKARGVDEKAAHRTTQTLKGANAGYQNFQADEADDWCVTPASS